MAAALIKGLYMWQCNGVTVMCRTGRVPISQAERWTVQSSSRSRQQKGLNNEFYLFGLSALSSPLHKTLLGY